MKFLMNSLAKQGRLGAGVSSHSERGFTLAELIVSASIVAVITAVVLVNHGEIIESSETRGAIERIDVLLREAQVRATGSSGHQGDYSAGIGLHFVDGSDQYTYFADRDGSDDITSIANNFKYRNGDPDSVISTETVPQNFAFSLCAAVQLGDPCENVSELNIVYLRPDAGPYINDGSDEYNYAEIEVEGPRTGTLGTLKVYSTGRTDVE